MRVLHFFKTYYPNSFGGVEQMIHQLANTLAPDVQSTVLSLAPLKGISAPAVINQSKCIEFPTAENYKVEYSRLNFTLASTGFSLPAIFDFKRLVKQADIIHYHFPNPFADFLHQICGVRKPTLITYHSDIIKQKRFLKLYQPLMHRFLNQVDCIISTSENYIKTSNILPNYPHKTTVIPIGVQDVYEGSFSFTNHPDYQNKSRYWQQRLDKPYFLFVGTLRYYKGLHLLIDALKILQKSHANEYLNINSGPKFDFVIAGGGALFNELQELINKNQLNQLNQLINIHLLGEVSDLDKNILYQNAYAFIFPSHIRTEAFGISLVEAAMHGKAMLSFEIGTGSSFINQHQITGEVLPLSTDALAQALQRWMHSPEKVKMWGGQARQRFLEFFQAAQMAQSYAAIYQKLLSKC